MKILLDECVPKRLANEFPFHVSTVQQLRLSGLDNGKLLTAIENDFDVLITVDQNLEYQQNLKHSKIGILVLAASSNRYHDLKQAVPACLAALEEIKPGQVRTINIK